VHGGGNGNLLFAGLHELKERHLSRRILHSHAVGMNSHNRLPGQNAGFWKDQDGHKRIFS